MLGSGTCRKSRIAGFFPAPKEQSFWFTHSHPFLLASHMLCRHLIPSFIHRPDCKMSELIARLGAEHVLNQNFIAHFLRKIRNFPIDTLRIFFFIRSHVHCPHLVESLLHKRRRDVRKQVLRNSKKLNACQCITLKLTTCDRIAQFPVHQCGCSSLVCSDTLYPHLV